MAFLDLDDAIAKLRAAANGSASLDTDVKNYLGIGGASQPTRRLNDMLALRASGKDFDFPPEPMDGTNTHAFRDVTRANEVCCTFGTPPEFHDHSHGWHVSNAILAGIIVLLKYREGRQLP